MAAKETQTILWTLVAPNAPFYLSSFTTLAKFNKDFGQHEKVLTAQTQSFKAARKQCLNINIAPAFYFPLSCL